MTRVPISVASRKGVSWLADSAEQGPVVLTSFSKPKAVVLSAAEVEELKQVLRDTADQVIATYVDRALERSPASNTLEDVCARLGFDPEEIRRRAAA